MIIKGCSARPLALGLFLTVVGSLVATGCTSGPPTPTRPPTSASTDASSTRGSGPTTSSDSADAVYLTTYSNNDGPTASAVVTGAIGDYGRAVSVHPDGSVDPEHRSQLELQLRAGTLRLDIAALDAKLVAAFAGFPSNRRTCSGTVSVSQSVPIVPGAGTGAYRGLTGSFTMSATIAEVDATAECGSSSRFLAQSIVFAGSGTVARLAQPPTGPATRR